MVGDKNPLAEEEDFFIPLVERTSGSQSPYASYQEDVEYFQKRLFEALRIPKEYLGHKR